MKSIKYSYTWLLAFAVMLCSCDGDNPTIPEDEVNSQKLSGTWTLGSNSRVLRDGDDITSQYANFSAFFTEQFAYFIEGDPNNVIHPEGTWQYVEGNFNQILLNGDERPITASLSDDNKILTLTFSNEANVPLGSRVAGITGSYTFILSKEQ